MPEPLDYQPAPPPGPRDPRQPIWLDVAATACALAAAVAAVVRVLQADRAAPFTWLRDPAAFRAVMRFAETNALLALGLWFALAALVRPNHPKPLPTATLVILAPFAAYAAAVQYGAGDPLGFCFALILFTVATVVLTTVVLLRSTTQHSDSATARLEITQP